MHSRKYSLPTAMYIGLAKCTRPPGSSEFAPVQPSALHALFTAKLAAGLALTGAGSCYDPRAPWTTMPDLAAVKNGSSNIGYLVLPAFRTHGSRLGDAVIKFSENTNNTTASCPWCKALLRDDACHAVSSCTHPRSKAIRLASLIKIASYMKGTSRACCHYYSNAQSKREQARLVLTMCSFLDTQTGTMGHGTELLTQFLCELRRRHPTYSLYYKGRPLTGLCYYGICE